MGKQINYWMDYDNFILLAQKALDLGCVIVKQDTSTGKVISRSDKWQGTAQTSLLRKWQYHN